MWQVHQSCQRRQGLHFLTQEVIQECVDFVQKHRRHSKGSTISKTAVVGGGIVQIPCKEGLMSGHIDVNYWGYQMRLTRAPVRWVKKYLTLDISPFQNLVVQGISLLFFMWCSHILQPSQIVALLFVSDVYL